MKKNIIRLFIAGLLVVVFMLTIVRPPQNYYPAVSVQANDKIGTIASELTINFILDARSTLSECESITGKIVRIILSGCPQCLVERLSCNNTLSEAERMLFTEAPISIPSGRMSNGVVTFTSQSPSQALAACKAAEVQSTDSATRVLCHPENSFRPKPSPVSVVNVWSVAFFMAALAASWLTGWIIIRYEHLHAHLTHDHVGSGPQKFHTQPTPRIGGLMVKAGLLAGAAVMLLSEEAAAAHEFGLLLLAGVPAFLGGLVEDVTKKVGVLERLLLTMLASGVAAWLLNAVLRHLDIPFLDHALTWAPFAIALTIVAVAGIANAINILDGYNGLVGGYSIIVLVAIAWVAAEVGDTLIFPLAVVLAGAMASFSRWNWPGGKIFLGDGGAYILGFLLAELSVLLVIRNHQVSPWFPLLLLIHPVFETCYSIYRRKLKDKLSPGQPDSRHLHQLIYRRIEIKGQCRLAHNSRVAKFLWAPTIIVCILGCIFWRNTSFLVTATIAYCLTYVMCYRLLLNSKK
jgi:UDP-GlcNAc:undecaprenyl-phosphate GlcNAc-1-phosphate transferase